MTAHVVKDHAVTGREGDMSKAGKDQRAVAALDQLEARPTPAERLFDRVGHRGFSRPNVAVSGRIFAKYRVVDPWDPDPKEPEDPIALGPVSLKLGERRRVAQHLAPPAAYKKKVKKVVDPIARYRPKPGQATRTPKPAAQAAPTPTPPPVAPPPAPRPTTELGREFGARDGRQPLRKPIPMRPDMAPSDGDPADDAGAVARPAAVVPRSVPRPKAPAAVRDRGSGGRFRMKPTKVSAPIVKEVRRLDEVTAEEAAAPAAAVQEQAPRPPMPPMSNGLDDLFGMAAMAGRMTLGKRREAAPEEPTED